MRIAALDTAAGRIATIDAEIVETIRWICRHTHIVSTLKRNKMVRQGRDVEMESAVNAARESQAQAPLRRDEPVDAGGREALDEIGAAARRVMVEFATGRTARPVRLPVRPKRVGELPSAARRRSRNRPTCTRAAAVDNP